MNALILAVLLTIPQAAPPVPREALNNPASTGRNVTKHGDADKPPTSQAEPSIQPVDTKAQENHGENPKTVDKRHPIRISAISEVPPVSVARDWIDKLSIVFTGILVIIGGLGVYAAYKTLRGIHKQAELMEGQRVVMSGQLDTMWGQLTEIQRQTIHLEASVSVARDAADAAKASADAAMAAERAWVIAELVPICVKFHELRWCRPAGNGWAAMSEEEILHGDHLKHKLKFTNMGRTPAHILGFEIGYSCLLEGVTDLPEGASGDIVESHPFDHLLAAGASEKVLDPIIDVNWYLNSSNSIEVIRAIKELKNTAVFHGCVRYQHVFSRNDIEEPFCYCYSPQNARLNRVIRPNYKQTNENQNPN